MRHWIVDLEATALPGWLEALPDALLFARSEFSGLPAHEAGILWWRKRAGETADEVLPQLALSHDQHILVLSDEPDESVVMQALRAGASGCCNSYAAPEVLRQVALVVGNGGLWIGQSLLQQLVGSTARVLAQRPAPAEDKGWAELLSEREAQVARLVAGAASNKEIASRLAISERTVKAHLTSIFEKLDLRDRLQLSLRINGLSL
jgi:DNA-binding NarL/FixJ family response regulator